MATSLPDRITPGATNPVLLVRSVYSSVPRLTSEPAISSPRTSLLDPPMHP